MFQTIADIDNNTDYKRERIYGILREVLRYQNIVIYILTFLISSLSIKSEIIPLGLAMVAACVGESIPVVGVFVAAIIGTAYGQGLAGLGCFFVDSVLYFMFVLLFKNKIAIEERNEIIKTGGKLFAANLIFMMVKSFIGVFLWYDFFMAIITSALLYCFYKVFVNGLSFIKYFNEKKAYSIEELIAGIIILGLASAPFAGINVYSMDLSTIIVIFLIMVLGWKNGMLLGATSGISLGLALTFVDGANLVQISMFAVSGFLAGLFNRFGKYGVVVGFITGNILLNYWTRGATDLIIFMKEVLVASVGLLLVPSNFKIDLEDLFGRDILLEDYTDRRLGGVEETTEKLETLSNILEEVTDIKSNKNDRESFYQDFLDNLEEAAENVFYQDISNESTGIAKELCDCMIQNDILTDTMLKNILEAHNNLLVMKDENVKNDLQEIVKIANKTFKSNQMNKVRVEEKNKNIEAFNNNMKVVSKVIDKCVNEIKDSKTRPNEKKEIEILVLLKNKGLKTKKCYIKKIDNGKYIVEIKFDKDELIVSDKNYIINIQDIISKAIGTKLVFHKEIVDEVSKDITQIYSSEDKFILQVGNSRITKDESELSGDSTLQLKLVDGKYLLAIADGMGTGEKARECSKLTLRMVKQMLAAGFDKKDSVELINSRLNVLGHSDRYSSLDLLVLDLYTGKAECIKNGACNTYIKNNKNIRKVRSNSLPVGILNKIAISSETVAIDDGDILIMCSDGVIESAREDSDKWFEEFLKNLNTNIPQKIADLIIAEAVDNNFGIANDDMTVIVCKILKRK